MIRKYIAAICLVLLAVALPAFAASVKNIKSAEVKALLTKNPEIFLLDVRTPEEYRQAHLRGAVLIPANEVERRLGEVPKNKTIIVYCAVGSRSAPIAALLAGKGYREVYHMVDGIVGWYRNGFSIDR